MVMAYLDTEDGRNLADGIMEPSAPSGGGGAVVEDLLETLKKNRKAVNKVIPMLPQPVFDYLTSYTFAEECAASFKLLDKDNSGTLPPDELFEVVIQMSAAE